MDRWLTKIVALLEAGDRDQRRAAARVLGALRPSAPEVVEALGEALKREDRALRARALEALGAIGGPGIHTHLLPLLDEEGELGRKAAALLAESGSSVMGQVKRGFLKTGPTARRRMLSVAVWVGGADGMDLIVRALEKGHAEEVIEIGQRLAETMEKATNRERNTLARRIDKFLASPTAKRDPGSAGAAVDLIARVLGPAAATRLFSYASPDHPPFVRRRALEALGRMASESPFPAERMVEILHYLDETDYANVVAPAMGILERAKLSAAHSGPLLKCLHGGDPALRRFAVTALGQVDTPTSAAALLEILKGDNPDLQKRAAVSLAKQSAAVPQVVGALAEAADSKTAWVLARILQPHTHRLKPDQVLALARAAAAWLEPGDSRAEAVISLLVDRHMPKLAEEGLKRVKKMKKERNAGAIVNLLRPLLRNGAEATAQVRYEVALAEIVRGRKDVVREVRLTNPGLQALEPLLHEDDFALLTKLKREKHFLSPEEYYLIGCHFAERPFVDRIFGGDLLRWLVQTFPDDSSSLAAANKLIMEGFPPPPQPRKRVAAGKKAPAQKPAPQRKPVAKKKPAPKKKPPAKKKAAKKKPAPKKKAAKKAPAPKKKAAKKKPAKKTVAKKKAVKKPARTKATSRKTTKVAKKTKR